MTQLLRVTLWMLSGRTCRKLGWNGGRTSTKRKMGTDCTATKINPSFPVGYEDGGAGWKLILVRRSRSIGQSNRYLRS